MDETLAREILKNRIVDNGLCQNFDGNYLSWAKCSGTVCIDGDFTARELKAIAWWMENHGTHRRSDAKRGVEED